MSTTHDRWTPHGRRLTLDTGQHVYTSRIGQQNVEDGGQWKPYVIDRVRGVVKFADSELRFTQLGVEHWRRGRRLSRFRADVEAYQAADWRRPVTSVGSLEMIEEDAGATAHVRCRYTLATAEGDATIELLVGGSHKVHLTTTLTAKRAGRQRIAWDVETPTRPQARATRPGPGGRPAAPQPYAFDTPGIDLHARWKPAEAPDHGYLLGDDRLRVYIGEQDYAIRQVKRVTPQTIGPTGIGNDADDGDQISTGLTGGNATTPTPGAWNSAGTFGNGNLYLERGGEGANDVRRWGGLGWRAIDLNTASPGVASIDSGTQLVLTNGGDNGTPGDISGVLGGVNAGGGTVWAESGNRPSAQTLTAATVNVTGSTGNQTIGVQTIVQEWVITEATAYEGNAGDDMYFVLHNVQAGQGGILNGRWWSFSDDYDGAGANVEATLTIVYTAGGNQPTPTTGALVLAGIAPTRSLGTILTPLTP